MLHRFTRPRRFARAAVWTVAVCLGSTVAGPLTAFGQPSGARPASKPVATPIAPPPGFVRVTVNGRTALCLAADEAWVKAGLSAGKPATQPTTRPADIVTKLAEGKTALAADMTRELSLSDTIALDALLNDELPEIAESYQALNPPVIFMVTTRESLKAALKSGWTNPQLRYNRVTEDVNFDIGLAVNTDGPMQEALMPAMYKAAEPATERAPRLGDFVARIDTDVAQTVANRCDTALQIQLVEFITKQSIDPLKLKPEQAWVGIGLANYFGEKYLSTITGANMLQRMVQTTSDPQDTPLRAASVDLVKPVPVEALREEVVPFYLDARRRKAAAVIFLLGEQTAADAPVRLLAALKANVPADNAGVIELIKTTTSRDPSDWLKPQ